MKIVSISCNECGAPLQINETTKYVVCQYCQSNLKIEESNGTMFSEVVKKVDKLVENIDIITVQNDLSLLDRNWDKEKEKYMRQEQNGQTKPYTLSHSIFEGIVYLLISLIIAGVLLTSEVKVWGVLITVLVSLASVFVVTFNIMKSITYKKLLNKYEAERKSLLNKLEICRTKRSN